MRDQTLPEEMDRILHSLLLRLPAVVAEVGVMEEASITVYQEALEVAETQEAVVPLAQPTKDILEATEPVIVVIMLQVEVAALVLQALRLTAEPDSVQASLDQRLEEAAAGAVVKPLALEVPQTEGDTAEIIIVQPVRQTPVVVAVATTP